MTIKIQCPCGVKYTLDLTAENLNNPVQFVCQQCGADSSAAINQIVRQQFAAQRTAAPVKVTVPAAAPRVSAPAQPAVAVCHHHADQPAVSNCFVCKKPICPECMALFGYVCSAYCAGQAERAGVELPVYEHQKSVVEARFWKKVRLAVVIVLAFFALLAGAGLWYNFSGSRPKPAYSFTLPEKRNEGSCKFVSQDQILIRHGNKLARYDLTAKKEVWAAALIDPQQIEQGAIAWVDARQFRAEEWKQRRAKLKAEGRLLLDDEEDEEDLPMSEAEQLAEAREIVEESLLRQMQFYFNHTDIWAAYTNKIVRFDWNTGAIDKEIPLAGNLSRFLPSENSLLAICSAPFGERLFTYVRLPGGETQTNSFKPEPTRSTNLARARLPDLDIPLRAMTVHLRPDFIDKDDAERFFETAIGTYIVNTGPSVAEMEVTMVEEKITKKRTMKEKPAKSVLDGEIRVTQAAELFNEMANEAREQITGGVRFEDESRYAVRLRRKLASGTVPDWVGEVTGPPQLFPLKTVDVLTAGTTMIVIDKQNQRRWEAKLAYPASPGMILGGGEWDVDEVDDFMPCVERGNTLYFFDQGVLAAFDIATGNARWRLPSVGVSSLHFDDKGMMYVTSTSAQQDQIKYSDQIDITRRTVPTIMKVDPQNGKLIWTLRQTGAVCRFSGKYFYSFEASTGGGKRFGKEVSSHTRIYRIHPRDGRVIWDHIERQFPLDVDFRDNQIVALFPNEVKVLKFLSL